MAGATAPGLATNLGAPDAPLFFHWSDPPAKSDAARRPDKQIALVRQQVDETPLFMAPAEIVADKVVDEILARGLGRDALPIAIALQGFGMQGDPKVDLTTHPLDSIPQITTRRVIQQDAVIFMENGVQIAKLWMQNFLKRYRFRQDPANLNTSFLHRGNTVLNYDPDVDLLPAPSRFHFDAERRPNATNIALFDSLLADPRANTQFIKGFGRRTLRDLYNEYRAEFRGAPGPPHDVSLDWDEGPNRIFYQWYQGVVMAATEGAMNEAAYELVRAAWPDNGGPGVHTLVSNFNTSAHYDRQQGRFLNWTPWADVSWTPRADLMSPVVFNTLSKRAKEEGYEDRQDWFLPKYAPRIEHVIGSAGGPDALVPRIRMPWTPTSNGGSPTRDMIHGALSLLRAKKVTEFVVFEQRNIDPAYWDLFTRLKDQVYDDVVALGVTGVVGQYLGTGDQLEQMRYSLGDFAEWGPADANGRVSFAYDYDTQLNSMAPPDMMRLNVVFDASGAPRPPDFQVLMQNHTTGALDVVTDRVGTQRGLNNLTVDIRHNPPHLDLSDYVDPNDGSMNAVMNWLNGGPEPYTVKVDLVQLVPKDAREPFVAAGELLDAELFGGLHLNPKSTLADDLRDPATQPLFRSGRQGKTEKLVLEHVKYADPRDEGVLSTNVRLTVQSTITDFRARMEEILARVWIYNHNLDEDDLPIGYQKKHEELIGSPTDGAASTALSFDLNLLNAYFDPIDGQLWYSITFADPVDRDGITYPFHVQIDDIEFEKQNMPDPYQGLFDPFSLVSLDGRDAIRIADAVGVPEPVSWALMLTMVFARMRPRFGHRR